MGLPSEPAYQFPSISVFKSSDDISCCNTRRSTFLHQICMQHSTQTDILMLVKSRMNSSSDSLLGSICWYLQLPAEPLVGHLLNIGIIHYFIHVLCLTILFSSSTYSRKFSKYRLSSNIASRQHALYQRLQPTPMYVQCMLGEKLTSRAYVSARRRRRGGVIYCACVPLGDVAVSIGNVEQ